MEFWDIYDINKKPTGRTMKRNDWCLKDGESSYDAVLREVKEETGLDVSSAQGGYLFTYKRENPGEGDNYFVDVYRFVMDVKEEDLHLQEEETDGHMFATLNQIKEFAAQGKFLHYDSIQAAFENL